MATKEKPTTKKRYKFKVMQGKHTEEGILYGRGTTNGSVIDTDRNLGKIFVNKFSLITDDGTEVVPAPDTSIPAETTRKNQYTITKKGAGYFNVVSLDDDQIQNTRGLRRDDAEALIADLGGELVDADEVTGPTDPE